MVELCLPPGKKETRPSDMFAIPIRLLNGGALYLSLDLPHEKRIFQVLLQVRVMMPTENALPTTFVDRLGHNCLQ